MNARDFLRQATGLNLEDKVVTRAMQNRMQALGLGKPAYQALLHASAAELGALTELVVVPESWMFRDPEAFVVASALVRQRHEAQPGRQQRLLSVPCAGGEEPYSLAMALADAGVPASAFAIDAFDLSEVALARARQGNYTRNAFRGGELGFRERYFAPDGANFQICETIRRQVNFSQGNLLDAQFGASARYDVVFCRNLLIYFDEATTAAAVAALAALLHDDGMLFAGYAEVPAFCRYGFATVKAQGAFALRKSGSVAPAPPAVAVPAPLQPVPPVPRAPAPRRIVARPAAAERRTPPPAQAPTLADARRLADLGQLDQAAAICRAILHAMPDDADAYFILGLVAACRQQAPDAVAHWRRCVYLDPAHYEALCHLALQAEQDGARSQAAALKERARRVYQRRHEDAGQKERR